MQVSSSFAKDSRHSSLPSMIDGFEAYAPELAHSGGGFKSSYFDELARFEEGNFWFRARNKIIIWTLHHYVPRFSTFLEVGCGTGFVLSGIAKSFPAARLTGSEIYTDGLKYAARRLPSVKLIQMDARRIPFVDQFDVVGAFDVLEHIKKDTSVLEQTYNSLRKKGILIITVPQHKWLWSKSDQYAFHERRYAAAEIEDKVKTAGFQIIRSTSFVTSLLPAMLVSRLYWRFSHKEFNPAAELHIDSKLDFMFEKMIDLELLGIKHGANYPIGGSRLIVSQKI